MIRLTSCLIFLFTLATLSSSLTYLDQNNQPTNWFAILKYPKKLTKYQPRHAYLSDNNGSQMLIINNRPDQYGEAIPNTIKSINRAANVLAFNDDIPGIEVRFSNGHAKGIIAYDEYARSGIYISHSLPNFPEVRSNQLDYEFPSNTYTYGQHVYCMSFNSTMLDEILLSLAVVKPHSYFSKGIFRDFNAVFTRGRQEIPSRIINWNLGNGDNHYFFTKSPKHPEYLYEDIISKHFRVNLHVSSWGRPYQLPSCALSQRTLNVKKIGLHNGDSWTGGSDHSKWAVSEKGFGPKVTCFCDLNRMASQKSRGGGCLCSSNKNLHEAFSKIVAETDYCGGDDEL